MRIIFFILISLIYINTYGQLDSFLVGIYSCDYDNTTLYIPPGTDAIIGNDYNFQKQLADLNFNYLQIDGQLMLPPTDRKYVSDHPSLDFLDVANTLNLKIMLSCPDIQILDHDNPIYNHTQSIAAVNYYGGHPALLGFSIHDEPKYDSFNVISQFATDIRNYNDKLLRISNLLSFKPNWLNKSYYRGSGYSGIASFDDYKIYVESCISITNPNIISFDDYPIEWKEQLNFFLSLEAFRASSVLHSIPFIYVLTPTDGYNVSKSIPQFNYVIYSALTYGAKGINYWYRAWYVSKWDEVVPVTTMQYLSVLHNKLIQNSSCLLDLSVSNVYHVSNISTTYIGETEQIIPQSLWVNFFNDQDASEIFDLANPIIPQNGSKIDNIVISFATDSTNNKYFWIFNKSITDDEYIQMNFKENTALINILDHKIYQEAQSRVVYLEPGMAKLFMINKDFQSDVSICNKNYYSGIYSDVWAESINIGGGLCNVNYYNGSKINYYASQILLKNGVKAHKGSRVSFSGATMNYGTSKNAVNSDDFSTIDQNKEIEQIINVFPNPNLGQVTISTTNKDYLISSVKIYSLTGIKVMDINNLNKSIVDIELNLKTGTYLLKISSNKGCQVKKLIVK